MATTISDWKIDFLILTEGKVLNLDCTENTTIQVRFIYVQYLLGV